MRSIVRVTEMSELLLSSSTMTHFHSFDWVFVPFLTFMVFLGGAWGCLGILVGTSLWFQLLPRFVAFEAGLQQHQKVTYLVLDECWSANLRIFLWRFNSDMIEEEIARKIYIIFSVLKKVKWDWFRDLFWYNFFQKPCSANNVNFMVFNYSGL